MFKVGICGAHGTGKTTLLKKIYEEFKFEKIDGVLRNLWRQFGVDDFENLPPDIRSLFQKYILMKQIELEDQLEQVNFVTDRTPIDFLAYTKLNSQMSGIDFKIYEALVRERIQNYTHFIYVPVEFEAEREHLRAYPQSQNDVDHIIKQYLQIWFDKKSYLQVSGTIEERFAQIQNYLQL